MYEISVKSHFSSAHHLRGHRGACSGIHGHNWEAQVFLRGRQTDAMGMLADFQKIKLAVRDVFDALDHKDLNRLPAFARLNPTAENIARHVFRTLAGRFRGNFFRVHRVCVSESPGTSACYWEEREGRMTAARQRLPAKRRGAPGSGRVPGGRG